jgi:tRNA-2-methylthio-N6-dimethylallyladenosine synthase
MIIIPPMKYHVWTEGCQMNVADSQRLSTALEDLGYEPSAKAEDADVVVLNTCVVRQSAEDKAYGRLTSLQPLKTKHPERVIALMGCLVGVKENPNLKERFPYVDVFAPPSNPAPLIKFLLERDGKVLAEADKDTHYSILDESHLLPPSQVGRAVTANLPIVLGCSHACTYCVIPYRRGREVSRPPEEILTEALRLADQGVKEITLLGQIVDRYGKDNVDFPSLSGLLGRLHAIEGLERIRFLTSHPNWMTDELIKTAAELPKVMPHMEVPVQAGDDEVLLQMRRGYTSGEFRDLIGRIRNFIPGVSIGTDVIVGFPNETDAQFQNTYDLLSELRLDIVHLARYSPRPDTWASRNLEDNVSDDEKWRRFRLLEDLQEKIATGIHATLMDRTVQVLFEGIHKNRWKGRSETNKLVFTESGDNLRGLIRQVRITRTGAWSLTGTLVEPSG